MLLEEQCEVYKSRSCKRLRKNCLAKVFETSTSLENIVSLFKTTSLPKNEGQLCLAEKHPSVGVMLPSSWLNGNPGGWESTVWAPSLVSTTLLHQLFLPYSGPAFSRQSLLKSLCCAFNRDPVQPPEDRAWRRKGEKKIKEEWILPNRVRHFSQSLIMFRPIGGETAVGGRESPLPWDNPEALAQT